MTNIRLMRSIIILAVLVSAIFTSCTTSSSSGEYTSAKRKSRVHEAYLSTSTLKWEPLDPVQVRFIDSMYKAGDIITLGESKFIVDSIAGGAR